MRGIEVKEFNLEGDWNWNKIISKGDEWVESQAYDSAYDTLLEYLGIDSEEDLTEEVLDKADHLIDYLTTDYTEGGLGVHDTSPTYYAYYSIVRDWRDNLECGF